MPVQGLPLILEILLRSLVEGQILKHWNVFSDSQSIVAKLMQWDLNSSSHGPYTNTGQLTTANMLYYKKAPSQVNWDAMRKIMRQSGNCDRRQTMSQTVHEEKENRKKKK